MKIDKIENEKDNHDIILYERLFKQYYHPLFLFAYRYVKNEETAENIIHDVFLILWNERKKLNFALNIKTYLYNAVKNRCIDYLRRKKIEHKFEISHIVLDVESKTPETILLHKELEYAIQNALNDMPKKRREIFVMNRFDRLTYSEIASILNISVKTVETQMSRSLKFLRKKLAAFILFLF